MNAHGLTRATSSVYQHSYGPNASFKAPRYLIWRGSRIKARVVFVSILMSTKCCPKHTDFWVGSGANANIPSVNVFQGSKTSLCQGYAAPWYDNDRLITTHWLLIYIHCPAHICDKVTYKLYIAIWSFWSEFYFHNLLEPESTFDIHVNLIRV